MEKITGINEITNIVESVTKTVKDSSKIKNTDVLDKAIEYIHKHYDNPKLSVNEICEYVNYTTSHFTRLFKKFYDTTPAQYINIYRICVAKKFIGENIAINRVCEMVGFSNMRTFNRVFKQVVNMTPTEYRKDIIK